jgi:hypothetical protein
MTDGEDTAVHPVQLTVAHTVIDRAPAEAGIDELAPAHDAVLPRGEYRDPDIRAGLVGLFIHQMNKSTAARSSPP